MTMKKARLLDVYHGVFPLLVFLALSADLHAQAGTATWSGMVTDPTGGLVPDAQITLESIVEKVSHKTVMYPSYGYTGGHGLQQRWCLYSLRLPVYLRSESH
jgi:hypothetical protein